MLSRLFRQTDHTLASLAATVNVCLSVAYAVALEAEKSFEFFEEAQEICVFLAPFVEILGIITEQCPT